MTRPHIHLVLIGAVLGCGCLSPDDPTSESVEAATATSSITDDAYTASAYPGDAHGSETYLVLGTASGNLHHVYMKLLVSGIPSGATNIKATLGVTPQSSASDVINAHCGTSNSWSEAAITWDNQTSFSSTIASHVGTETSGTAADFDVSSCVTGNGTYTVVLDEPSGAVVKFDSTESTTTPPTLTVTYTPQATCTGPNANLVPCTGKRWEGANPTLNGIDVADLQAFEAMQGAQLGAVHFFRSPGASLWSNAGGFQEQVYLNTSAPATNPRYLYLGYRPNGDWSLFDGAGTDDAATIARIHTDAQRTITLYDEAHRKVWINAVNHEAERYIYGCGGNNATNPNNTVATYQAAWRNVVKIFDAEFAAAGITTNHTAAGYPVVWVIDTQNLNKSTNSSTCKSATGGGVTSFRQLMLDLVPRNTDGSLIASWFGWNPYTDGGGTPLATVIDDGYNWLTANAPADVQALPWNFGEFGYIGANGPPSAAQGTSDFNALTTRLNANSWPNVRMLLYFDDVSLQDPATVGFAAAFKSYATSSTMVRY